MSISTPFIRRPVGTSLLSIAILLAGALAYTKLPVSPLPEVEFPTISVNANLPGASPETMASAVATPLERQFGRGGQRIAPRRVVVGEVEAHEPEHRRRRTRRTGSH